MINKSQWYIYVNKENIFKKVTKIFFPDRDAILYYFGIDLNIIYSTKHKISNYSGIYRVLNSHIFFHFLKYIDNDLKIDQRSLFQTSSGILKPKQMSLEN